MSGCSAGNVFILGDFDDEMEKDILLPLTLEVSEQAAQRPGEGWIDLYINSMGGHGELVRHMIELVELAKRNGVVVRTIVPDSAFSAGSMLAVTGTPGERYISRTATHLIHYGSISGPSDHSPVQIARFTKWKNAFFKNNLDHYNKYCDIPNLEENLDKGDFLVTAKEAIKWGMADQYMDKLELLL